MNDLANLTKALHKIRDDITALLAGPIVPLHEASIPNRSGVYIFYSGDGKILYVGEARGRNGLQDRVLSKHVAGDDSHALQRAYKLEYPDRLKRRDFIRQSILVQWLEISDSLRIPVVERVLIWLLSPPLNMK